jgi:tRNA (guanine10-N2)-methyltransferase
VSYFAGPTSMDPELSLIMCNMTHVKKGALAYDPFVGTGSILVAAASLGATTWGADIDIRSAPALCICTQLYVRVLHR